MILSAGGKQNAKSTNNNVRRKRLQVSRRQPLLLQIGANNRYAFKRLRNGSLLQQLSAQIVKALPFTGEFCRIWILQVMIAMVWSTPLICLT